MIDQGASSDAIAGSHQGWKDHHWRLLLRGLRMGSARPELNGKPREALSQFYRRRARMMEGDGIAEIWGPPVATAQRAL